MKKVLSALMLVPIAISLCSCHRAEKSINIEETEIVTEAVTETETKAKVAIPLSKSYRILGTGYSIKTPGFKEYKKSSTEIFLDDGMYVTVTAVTGEKVKSLDEAFDISFKKFKSAIQEYSGVNDITISVDSEEKINGINTYKLEGTLNCNTEYSGIESTYEAFTKGYAFILNDIPCLVLSSVTDRMQSRDLVYDTRCVVDDMLKTLKEETKEMKK